MEIRYGWHENVLAFLLTWQIIFVNLKTQLLSSAVLRQARWNMRFFYLGLVASAFVLGIFGETRSLKIMGCVLVIVLLVWVVVDLLWSRKRPVREELAQITNLLVQRYRSSHVILQVKIWSNQSELTLVAKSTAYLRGVKKGDWVEVRYLQPLSVQSMLTDDLLEVKAANPPIESATGAGLHLPPPPPL